MTGNRDLTARITLLARPAWLPESVWPFETAVIEVEGSKIAITDVGQGPVLLFVHTGFWSFIWRDVILRLAPDFRCICFDAPGTGRSDRLPADRISLDRASRALTTIIRTLNLQGVTLVVHDLGGPSGIAGAARVPMLGNWTMLSNGSSAAFAMTQLAPGFTTSTPARCFKKALVRK